MAIATAPDSTLSLDDSFGSGPTSSKLIARTLTIYAAMFVLGLAPVMFNWSAPWQAAGLGLIFPGGGFVALGGWWVLMFPLTVMLMLTACALWQLMANVFAPMFIWIGSLILATALSSTTVHAAAPYVVPAIALGFLGWVITLHWRIAGREMKRRDIRNAYLPRAELAVLARATPRAAPGTREMSREELAHLRYVLDRGLQPVASLQGFDVIEQFQTSAIRYQINSLLWALQIAQCHYTPNFHGYLSQAQRNLIDKLTLPKVWKWWRWESLFGDFSFNTDPIAKNNIMFAGFSSANVALYTATTGDGHYLQDGSLTFHESATKSYKHSLKTMIENGRYNHGIATYGPMYPCEPTLTYSACNIWGNFQHLVGDRILGTDYRHELIKKLRVGHITEMMTRDGVPHSGRVNPLGIRLPAYTCNMVSALWGWMANSFFPDLSRRVWAILREEAVTFDANGEIKLTTLAYDRIDTGNYHKSEFGLYAHMLIYAREQGDEEVASAIVRKLARDFGRTEMQGTVSYKNASNRESGSLVMGMLMRNGDIRSMVHHGPPACAMRGPLLGEVVYPDVLVAKAYSDGSDLKLVLYPGTAQAKQTISFERMLANSQYSLQGSGAARTIRADEQGHAQLDVELSGRTELHLSPLH